MLLELKTMATRRWNFPGEVSKAGFYIQYFRRKSFRLRASRPCKNYNQAEESKLEIESGTLLLWPKHSKWRLLTTRATFGVGLSPDKIQTLLDEEAKYANDG